MSISFAVLSLLTFPALALAQAGGAKPLITRPVNETHLTILKGNTYPLALPRYDHGPAPASLPMDRMILVLKRSPEQEAALDTLLAEQQDKSSPNYHRWLTPAQFGQEFGLSTQDIQTIVSWLESNGFQIASVAAGRDVIEFSGTAGEVRSAFHATIHRYVVNGKSHWANASDPSIPSALTPAVGGIVSLNNFPRRPFHKVVGLFRKSQRTGAATPIEPTYTTTCGSYTCYALGPYDFATIYNVLPLWSAGIDGAGETIAIVGRSDINPQDVADFRSQFGMPAPNLVVIHNGPDPGILSSTGDETESDLDVEWSGAVAKGATIDFVVSESTETTDGVDLSAEYIVDHDLAPVMSESYGACELELGTAGNRFYDQLWQQAAAEGISAVVAAGDGGSATCDQGNKGASAGLSVNGIASTPYNIAAGGTDFHDGADPTAYWNSTNNSTTQESAKGYIPETTWNDTCTNAELALVTGGSSDAETNCNNTTLVNQYPFLLYVTGGGGGSSNCVTSTTASPSSCGGGYPKPSWQTGNGVPNDGVRDVPDISLFSGDGFNGNFYIMCEDDQQPARCSLSSDEFLGVGGTSAAAPAFAAILAMAIQKKQARLGNANYVLYPLAAKTGASCNSSGTLTSSCIFYDVTSGTIAMPCLTNSPDCSTSTAGDTYGVLSGYYTTAGYDRATGLGSVNAANLVNDWSSVTFKPTTTTLQLNGGSAVNVTHGTPVTVSISVSPGSPTPTGVVSLIATQGTNSFDAGTFTLSNGAVSSSTSLLPGGTSYSVHAHYAGDGAYGASDSSPVTVTVNPQASKTFANLVTFDANGNLTSYSATSATYGAGYFLLRMDVGDSKATYSPTTGISSTCSNHTASCPTGAITLTNNGSPFDGGSLTLNSEGSAEDQSLLGGSYAITATYPGDSSYGSSAATDNFTIAKAPTTASASVTGTPVQYGTEMQIVAGLNTTSDGIAPTGTFSFTLDGSPLTLSGLTYQGFPYYPTTSPPSYAYYEASGGAYFLKLGTHTLQATYSGDENYAASTSTPSTFTVTQALPSFGGIGASPTSLDVNQQVTLTATLYGSQYGVVPTGTIAFYNGTTALSGKVTYTTTSISLQASMLYTPTTAGTYDISAKYSGDTYYLPTESIGPTLTVLGPDFSLAPSSGSGVVNVAAPGDSGTADVTVTSQLGFTGTVNLSLTCPAPSTGITCSISPTSVDLTSSTTTASAKLTVKTTAAGMLPPADAPERPGWPPDGRQVILLCIFGLAMMFLWSRRHASEHRCRPAFALATLLALLVLASCGGGGTQSSPPPPSNPGTTTGAYSVTVTGTSGKLTHSTNLTVNVQ